MDSILAHLNEAIEAGLSTEQAVEVNRLQLLPLICCVFEVHHSLLISVADIQRNCETAGSTREVHIGV